MPLKPEAGLDFAAALNAATKLPGSFDDAGKDLPDGFPLMPGADGMGRIIDTDAEGIPGISKYDYKVHRKVFTTFRVWSSCQRCGQDIASGAVTLPDSGDYDCPHTSLQEYETVVNDILAGKLIYGSEQETTQRDGSVIVSLKWFEKILIKKKTPVPGVDGTVPEPSL